MKKWNLPETYSEIVQDHHREDWNHSNILLAIVRLANRTCHKLGVSIDREDELVLFSLPEVHVLGVNEITIAEMEIAIEDVMQQLGV